MDKIEIVSQFLNLLAFRNQCFRLSAWLRKRSSWLMALALQPVVDDLPAEASNLLVFAEFPSQMIAVH